MNVSNAISPTFKSTKTRIRNLDLTSDERIIAEYQQTKNRRILAPLFKKYNEKLFGLAFYYLSERESAMDTVMEAYEVVLLNIDQKEITYFKGWLFSICRNICLKKLRDGKKFSELTEVADTFMESEEEKVYNDETIEKVLELIPKLKDNQRKCVEAFYLKTMSYEEISAAYEMTFKEVKSHIQNGKRNLKILFEKSTRST
ncbi:MAG: sigma-70 family RNA polymerase sigma factor [Saprospiraceae bacterium]|nr:sigma-70 family RNA polymerase sigma factor [Saprospiraceae bacterium]